MEFAHLCSSDCTSIFVDDFIYQKRYFRYRFTLAHELGHRVLHKSYFDKIKFSSVSEWPSVMARIDSWDRDKMEYQAYMFAGMVLVPKEILRVEFNKQLQLIKSHIEQAKLNGIRREDYLATMLDAIANGLSPKFEVSRSVLSKRIVFEQLQQDVQ
jgi:Zn-dependent peptidase ImmA (M78 family)